MLERDIIAEAIFIIQRGATVRRTAEVFGTSKSTIYKDVTERLKNIDLELYLLVKEVLTRNKEERAIRGGMATRETWRQRKMKENN